MQNHTDCICLTFLHCVSSNVSSNCLYERMYNHTDCICLTFPRCALSNVLWEHLNIWMKIHIGCTCVTPYLGHSLPRYQQHRHSFQATQNLEGFYPLFLSEGWMSATWPHHVCLGTDYWALTGIDDDEKHNFSPKGKVKVYCSPLLFAVLPKKKRKWMIHHVMCQGFNSWYPWTPCAQGHLEFLRIFFSRACLSVRITIPVERIRIGTEGGLDLDRIGHLLWWGWFSVKYCYFEIELHFCKI